MYSPARVDVDGSYLYKKHRALTEAGKQVAPLPLPTAPVSGWGAINQDSVVNVCPLFPTATNG